MEFPGVIALILFASMHIQTDNSACLKDEARIPPETWNVKGQGGVNDLLMFH